MSIRAPSVPELRFPLSARLLHGGTGRRLRSALARRLPVTRHARHRMSRAQRCIPADLIRIVIRHGRAQDVARGVRLSLRGAHRPSEIPEARWRAATSIVVPLDEFGFVPTVFREGGRR